MLCLRSRRLAPRFLAGTLDGGARVSRRAVCGHEGPMDGDDEDVLGKLSFEAEVIHWRGPAPFDRGPGSRGQRCLQLAEGWGWNDWPA